MNTDNKNKKGKAIEHYIIHELLKNDFDVSVTVIGGGLVGQSEAVRHGLSRVLVKYNEEWKSGLKKMGLLTRDPREKERKKPGLKRARRAPQWSKR